MAIVFFGNGTDSGNPEEWKQAFRNNLPEHPFYVSTEKFSTQDIRYALVWRPPAGWLAKFENLEAIFVLGAGVDSVLSDPELPNSVPIIRLIDAGMADPMAMYTLGAVLYYQRGMDFYNHQRKYKSWNSFEESFADNWSIGVMGLGAIGLQVSERLQANGFKVHGWRKTSQEVIGLKTFSGKAQFDEFLGGSRILVNVLPSTSETRGMLGRKAFLCMPRKSYLINIGRGDVLVENDLMEVLDSGHLSGAFLDVFAQEPLPPEHPFWSHSKIFLTPHVAAPTFISEAQEQIITNIRKINSGETPVGLVNRKLGY